MSGAIPPLPNTPSWCGAQLKRKAQGQLYLYFTLPVPDPETKLTSLFNVIPLDFKTPFPAFHKFF
jgi:hypothetical protein